MTVRILICEDDKRAAQLLRDRFRADHAAVDICYDGQEAVGLAGAVSYDVLVMDIMMPVRDGLSAVRELRQKGCDTPVIFLTAKDAVDDRSIWEGNVTLDGRRYEFELDAVSGTLIEWERD